MTSLSNRLLALAKSWPKDPFRPNMQLGVFLESLSTHPGLTRKAVAATEALKNDVLKTKVSLPRGGFSLCLSSNFQVSIKANNHSTRIIPRALQGPDDWNGKIRSRDRSPLVETYSGHLLATRRLGCILIQSMKAICIVLMCYSTPSSSESISSWALPSRAFRSISTGTNS